MKKVLVLGALLVSSLGFSQTVSGSVWRKVTPSATSQNKYIRRGAQMEICSNLPNAIIVQNTQWPINIQEYGCGGFGEKASMTDWGTLLQGMGVINNFYDLGTISTDPNNPTQIPISQYSDLLLTLHLTENSWSPQSFNEQYELHFKINETNLSNEDFNKSTVTVYPNPTSDYLNINTDDEINVKIFDLYGKMVMNQNVTKQISLSELNKGLYLVEVSNNDIKYKTKIIKK